jgi:type IV secretion system protein VirB4
MLGMGSPRRSLGRSPGAALPNAGLPRYWREAQAENPLARFVPFSSLVGPHDVVTRGGSGGSTAWPSNAPTNT